MTEPGEVLARRRPPASVPATVTADLKDVSTLQFADPDSHDEALAIIRANPGIVALALSLKTDGDLEVFFDEKTAQELIDALSTALRLAAESSGST
jgi:hypothetical protein